MRPHYIIPPGAPEGKACVNGLRLGDLLQKQVQGLLHVAGGLERLLEPVQEEVIADILQCLEQA